jgi:adenosine deaminase
MDRVVGQADVALLPDVPAEAVEQARGLPKVELHAHLDCGLSYEVVHRLDPGVSEATFRAEFIAPGKCADLREYLRYPPREVALMQTAEQLRLVTLDAIDQLRRDGVIYAELRFAPYQHVRGGLSLEQIVAAVDGAVAEGRARTGVEGRLILCTLRHFSTEQGLEVAGVAARFAAAPGSAVVAIDLAGDEANFPLAPHVPAFAYAAAHGLSLTAHAGEASGPASVREALAALHPARIGHGVRSAEDDELVSRLARERIHLEACPTSNVQTNVCATYADHPIDRLCRAGVSLGISTDTRTVSDVTLSQEYARLRAAFAWSDADFLRRNLDANEASFAPAEVKARIERRLREGYASAGGMR